MRGRLLALAFSDHYVYAGAGTIIDFPGADYWFGIVNEEQ
jgi:hypothetical protein